MWTWGFPVLDFTRQLALGEWLTFSGSPLPYLHNGYSNSYVIELRDSVSALGFKKRFLKRAL